MLATLCVLSGTATAAGLGRLTVQSALGQPLRAEIELLSVSTEEAGSIEARVASAEAFRQARLERSGLISELDLTITKLPDGQPVLRITSTTPVNDPFVDLLLELAWNSGRIQRAYTLLLDPSPDAKPPGEAQAPTTAPPVAAPAVTVPATRKVAKAVPPRVTHAVQAGESLRSIAVKNLHPDVTIAMMIASLYQANRHAFAADNVNMLKAGEVLTVPDRDTVMRMFSPHQAQQLLNEQRAAWHEIQGRLASQATQVVAETSAEAAGRGRVAAAPPPAPPAPAAPVKDVLRLSKGEPVQGNAQAADWRRELEEELAAKDRALQDALARVQQLENSVKDLQRLMELQAGGAAAPQQDRPVAAPVLPATPPEADKAGLLRTLLDYPLYLAGLAGALVVGLAAYMFARRRRQNLSGFRQGMMTEGGALKLSAVASPSGPGAGRFTAGHSHGATELTGLGLGTIDTHEVDPIAEADVYLAYHRAAQAEEILKDALTKNPGRQDLLLKLLEVYAASQDTANFAARARELQARLNDPGSPIWLKVTEVGRRIDPDNVLYRTAGISAAPAQKSPVATSDRESTASVPAPESPAAAPAGELPSLDFSGIDLELTDVGREESAEPPADNAAEPDEMDAKLDLARACIDLGDQDGAHALIDEVLKGGSSQQKLAAEALLAGLQG